MSSTPPAGPGLEVPQELEQPRPPGGENFSDAITYSFADADAEVYGIARLGLTGSHPPRASGLALLLCDGGPAAARAASDVQFDGSGWEALSVAGLGTEICEPHRRWMLTLAAQADEEPPSELALEFQALGTPAVLDPDGPVGRAGGMQGYEALCRVSGTATVGGRRRSIDCLGQRGHSWGAPDWERIGLARTLAVWLEEDRGVTLTAIRPAGVEAHEGELVAAALWAGDGRSPLPVHDARLSTAYDADGHHRRAGLELWVGEQDGFALRAAGEVHCGSSLDLGRLRLDSAFYRWQMEGRTGVGRYDILRRA
ncbi:MAG TPA: hypothetical protein VGN69_04620 [Solirubrobacteraceae bacterium]|jgi:hypothetical protein|nr:hypothetical protein [Solirubrobacteraceae bacterium]